MANFLVKRTSNSTPITNSIEKLERAINSALSQGNLKLACEYISKIFNVSADANTPKEIEILNNFKTFYSKFKEKFSKLIENENYEEAISSMKTLDKIISSHTEVNLANERLDLLNNLSVAYRKSNRTNAANDAVDKALTLFSMPKVLKETKTSILLNKCSILSSQGEHEEALLYSNKAKALAKIDFKEHKNSEKSQQIILLAVAYHNSGVENEHLGNIHKALHNYKKSIDFLSKNGTKEHSSMLHTFKKLFEEVSKLHSFHSTKHSREHSFPIVSDSNKTQKDPSRKTAKSSSSRENLKSASTNNLALKNRATNVSPFSVENLWEQSEISENSRSNALFEKPPISRGTARVRGGRRKIGAESRASSSKNSYESSEIEKPYIISRESSRKNSSESGNSSRPKPGTIFRIGQSSSSSRLRENDIVTQRETYEDIDHFFAKPSEELLKEEKIIFEPEKPKEIPTFRYEIPKWFDLNEEVPILSISQNKDSYIEKKASSTQKNRENSNELGKSKNLLETLRLDNSDTKLNSPKNEKAPFFAFQPKSVPRTQLKIPDLSSSRSDSLEIKSQEPISAEPIRPNPSIGSNTEIQKIEVFNRQETKKFKLQPKIFKHELKLVLTKEDLDKMKKAAILIQKHFRRHIAEDFLSMSRKYKKQKILLRTCRKIQNSFYSIIIFQNQNLISAKASEVGKLTNELIYTVPENMKISPRELADRLDIDGYHALYLPEKEAKNSDNIRWTMITRIMKRVQDAGYLFQFYLNENNSKLMIKAHELGKNKEICSVFEEDITHLNEEDLIKYLNTEVLERIDIQNERIILNPKIEIKNNELPNLNDFDESKIVKIQRLFRKKKSPSKPKAEASNVQPSSFVADLLKSQKIKDLKFHKFGFPEENEENIGQNFPKLQFGAQNEDESQQETEKERKFTRPQMELLTDDVLIRSQKIFFKCLYLISLYKEVMNGNEYIRVEAFPTKKLPKPTMAMMKLREICEILELWENSEVYEHKEELLKYIDLKQGKVIIAKQPVSNPVNKELLFTWEKKLNTNFNYQVTFYEIESSEIKEKILIEAATLQEVIPIHIYLSVSKEEIAETLEINVKDIYKNLEKMADLLSLENSELHINKKKGSRLPPAILISLPTIRNYINASTSSSKSSKIESPKLPEISPTETIPCPTVNTLAIPSVKKITEKIENPLIPHKKLISMEEKAAIVIQKFIRSKNARELRKLLSMKNYRENHNKILGRGVRFINGIAYMVTVYSTKKGILVEVRDMDQDNLLEKIIDPRNYIFGFSKWNNIKMIIDSLAISNGKLAFLRNYKRHENINVQNKDYSYFENAVDEGLSLETATLRLQKWMRIVLAKRLLIRKRNEATQKLIVNKKKTIGGEDYMVSIFQTLSDYIVQVYSVNKPASSQWMYTKTYSLEDLKNIYGDIDTENVFKEIEIQNKKLVLIKPKYFGGGAYSKVQRNRGGTSRIDESSSSFCSISDEKLIMSQERILNFKKCIVNIGLDKRYNQKANKESEMIIFDVAPVSDALSRKQLSVDIKTASEKVGIPTQWLVPLCKYLLDNCLQVGEYSINLNMDVPKMDINLMATKIQRAYRGWRTRKLIGKIIKSADGGLIAMHKKNIHGKNYMIYAYAQNKRIKIEAECGKETVAMYLDAEILKSIGDTTRKKFLETKIFPFIGIHDQGILRKLYFEKRNIVASTNLPVTSSQSILKAEPEPQKVLNLPNISKNQKNLSQAISYFNQKATEMAKLETSGDMIKRKGQNPRQKDDKKNSREEIKYSRSGSSVNQSLSSSRNINSSVTNTFYLSEPPKLLFQTVSSINKRQLSISLYGSSDGILVETVDQKNKKLSLQLETSIPSNTPEEVIERICRDIIARLYIDKSTGEETLVLGQGEVIYKKRQMISDRSFLVSGIKRHDGITLTAFDPGSKQTLECKIGKSVWNEENLQEELEKVVKKLKVVKILGDDALILN